MIFVKVQQHVKKQGQIRVKSYVRKKRPLLKKRLRGKPIRVIPIRDPYG